MVSLLADYTQLLQESAAIFGEILNLYAPDARTENDWAATTVAEARAQRNGLLERLLAPLSQVTAENTSPLLVSFSHFIDRHWADYQKLPTPSPTKRQQVAALHAQLTGVMRRMGELYNAVRNP